MATKYRIQIGDEVIDFEGPDDLSDAEIQHLGDNYLKTAKPGQEFPDSVYIGDVVDPSLGPPPEEADSSALGSYARGVTQGGTLNFGDEISAFANAAVPGLAALDDFTGMAGNDQQAFYDNPEGFWAAVRNNMGDFSEQKAADLAQHPTAHMLGEVSGAVGTLPVGSAVAGRIPVAAAEAMAARPVLTAMGLGGATGAVSGAGAGTEGNRAQSAALGGLGGTALGGAIGGAMELAPAIANYGKIFFGKMADSEAIRQITKALQRDGYDVQTPSGVQKLKAALQEFTGKPVSLADVGGATRSRTGVGLRTPSAAQQQAVDVLQNRTAGQGQRLAGDVRANVAPRTDVHTLDEALVAQRAQEAERLRELALYEQAPPPAEVPPELLSEAPDAGLRRVLDPGSEAPAIVGPPDNIPSGRQSRIVDPADPRWADDPEKYQLAVELQNLARLPDAQKALTGALKVTEAERARLAATGQSIDHLPDLSRGSNLDVRAFDAVKRYLDDEIMRIYKRGEGDSFKMADVANVRALRDDIRDRLKKFVPEYEDYLNQYAGSSEMIDSLRAGRDYTKLSPEQIGAEQSRRSTAGQELYRTGAARDMVDDLLSRDRGFAADRISLSDEAKAQRLAMGIDPSNADALNRSVAQERTLNLLPKELGGAQTMQRSISQADANAGIDMTVPFNPGSPIGWLGMVARGVRDRVSLARNEAVNTELLPRMMETDPKIIGGIIDELEANGQTQLAAELRRKQLQTRGGFLSGAVIGAPVAIGE